MSLSKKRVFSILESFLFVSPEPRSFSEFEALFKGDLKAQEIKKYLEELADVYNKEDRGLVLEKVDRAWQMRTKLENKAYLSRVRPSPVFRLSKPSLEVLAIIAFEQPCPKIRIDEIRGVDSGHLLRTLIDKKMICWAGQSDIPGKPSLYKTTKSFLETFGLESLKALPSKQELEELFGDLNDTEDTKTLQSVTEEWDENQNSSSKNLQEEQKDEEESKNIKSLLKSFPAHFDFLKKSEENQKTEEKEKETQESKEKTTDKEPEEKPVQKTEKKEKETQESKEKTTDKEPEEKPAQKTEEKEKETQESKEKTTDKEPEEKPAQKTEKKEKETQESKEKTTDKKPEERPAQKTEKKKVKEQREKETENKKKEDTEE